MALTQTPYFTHDCNKCTYLGSMLCEKKYDWYVCGDSIVARYGDEGPMYWSSLQSIVLSDKYLTALHGNRTIVNAMNILARHMLLKYRRG